MATPRELREQSYSSHKAEHPETSFAQWMGQRQLTAIANGREHATLGPRLTHPGDWWEAGAATFAKYCQWFPIQKTSHVVDYGCGSLRIGGHFIRLLEPGHYFGLDVLPGFYEMGQELVGNELLQEKQPRLAVIDAGSVDAAVAFGADIICSNAVCFHVHPDEAPAYFRNLARLASKPGATLFFDASVSDYPVGDRQLSMRMDYYRRSLSGLEFISFRELKRGAEQNRVGIFEFRRPA